MNTSPGSSRETVVASRFLAQQWLWLTPFANAKVLAGE
jgi:hypothetical protein